MKSSVYSMRGMVAALTLLLGQLIAVVVMSLVLTAAPANAQGCPPSCGFPGGPGGGSTLSYEMTPTTPDYDDDISITVTPSTTPGYTGDVNLNVSEPGQPAIYSETITVNGSPALFEVGILPPGDYHVDITYFTDFSNVSFDFTVTGPPEEGTSLALTLNNSPASYGEPVTFTAQVTGTSNTPVGKVTFYDGATPIQSDVVLDGFGKAEYTTSSLNTGSHTIKAVFTGAGLTSSEDTKTQVINDIATSLTLTLSTPAASVGDNVKFIATVTRTTGSGTPSGKVTFLDGSTPIQSDVVVDGSGKAEFTTSSLTSGSHTIKAVFTGSGYTRSEDSKTQTVSDVGTSLALSSSKPTSNVGDTVKFTATVMRTTGSGTPSGKVTFLDGSTPIQSDVVLDGLGKAEYSTSALSQGTHTIKAVFTGTGYVTSNNTVSQQVNVPDIATSMTLVSDINPSVQNQEVKFTATITPPISGGQVHFTVGTHIVGSSTPVNGVATYFTSTLPLGHSGVFASLQPPSGYESSSSNTVQQQVEALTPAISPAGMSNANAGSAVSQQFTVINGAGTYTFTAEGLPTGVSMNSTGLLSGTPTSLGTKTVIIRASQFGYADVVTVFDWTIAGTAAITPAGGRANTVGDTVDVQFAVTGDSDPYTFEAEGLPTGLSMDEDGHVTGKPSATQAFSTSITATSGDKSISSDFTWTISPVVVPAVSTTLAIKASPKSVKYGGKVKLKGVLTARNNAKVTGRVTITVKLGSKVIASPSLKVSNGKITWNSPKLKKPGTYKVSAAFVPSDGAPFRPSKDTETFKVKPKNAKAAAMAMAAKTAPLAVPAPVDPATRILGDAQLLGLNDAADLMFDVSGGGDGAFIGSVENAFAFAPNQLDLSGSLSAIQEAAGNEKRGAFDVWGKGSFRLTENGTANAVSGLVALGADYMFSPALIGGIGLSLDRQAAAEIGGPGSAEGMGWLVTPYLKGKIADFLGYGVTIGGGGLVDHLSPEGTYTDTVTGSRFIASARVDGTFELPDEWRLTPTLSASYVEQRMDAYLSGSGANIAASTEGLARLAISPALEKTFTLSDDGTTITVGGNLQLALETENTNGVFAMPGWQVGAGLNVELGFSGGASLRGALDLSRTQAGSTSFRGTLGLSADIN